MSMRPCLHSQEKDSMTQRRPSVLLVSNGNKWHRGMEALLKRHEVEIWNARSFEEMVKLLGRTHPEVIIAATVVAGKSWREMVRHVAETAVPTNVIVVAESDSSRLYLTAALDCGAFEFLVPPLERETYARVVQVAAKDARRQRRALAMDAGIWSIYQEHEAKSQGDGCPGWTRRGYGTL